VLWTAIALACLPCAVHLWLRPGRGAWVMHVSLCLVMAVHPVVAAVLPAAGHLHAHGPATAWTTAPSLLAGLGLFPCGVALVARPRPVASPLGPPAR
jgi:hypothetical protein